MRISDWSSDVCSSDLRLQEAMVKTGGNTNCTLTLALSYSARWEITEAARRLAKQVQSGEITPDDIDESRVAQQLTTDRKSVVSGKSVSVREDLGGGRSIKKKNKNISNTIYPIT